MAQCRNSDRDVCSYCRGSVVHDGDLCSAGVGVVEKVCVFIMLGFYNGIGKTRFVMVQVEAARAGEAGKGFAVVANQVNAVEKGTVIADR